MACSTHPGWFPDIPCWSAGGLHITTYPRPLQILDQPLGDNLCHQLVRVVHALPAFMTERVGHGATVRNLLAREAVD